MSPLAISTGLAVLAIIGLVLGLVVLGVVIKLFSAVLSPTRQIARHAREAPDVAPVLTNGVQGVDELRRTRQLSEQVPPLALAYLAKVTGGAPVGARPAMAAYPAPDPSPVRPAAAAPGPPSPGTRGLEGLIRGGKP